MLYKEMTKFLNDNDIKVMQPVIANEVNSQLEESVSDIEFENICQTIYDIYLDCVEEPDIWCLVDEELIKRGYKSR